MNSYPMPAELREASVAYLKHEPEQIQNKHSLGQRLAVMGICASALIGYSVTNNETQTVRAESPVISLADARAAGMFSGNFLDDDDTTVPTMKVVTTNKATTTTVKGTTTTEAPTSTAEAAKLEFVEPGVIGEKPCGPEVNPEEVKMRHAAGEIVIKPGETAAFLDKYPQVEDGLNDLWERASNGDTRWISFIADEKTVLNPEVIDGKADTGVRALKSRMEADLLIDDIDLQNHACDLETGRIFANPGVNGHNNHLKAGDQVWGIDLTKEEQQKMEELGIALPASLLTVPGAAGALTIILERIACNNPLLELPPPPPAETTTTTIAPTTTILETTTTAAPTTTAPESTTSTSTSTTSTTSTTIPPTTTLPKGTVPPTTICVGDEYNPNDDCDDEESTTTSSTSTTVPRTTTTTSTVPKTTTTTTSTTMPPTTSTSTTVPATTTSTSTTTTSTTSTTSPPTTTTQPKGTVPPTTGCSEELPC